MSLKSDIILKLEDIYKDYRVLYNELSIEECYDNLIEVNGNLDGKPINSFISLRVSILDEYKQVQIPNIFMPEGMRRKGIGKIILRELFLISDKYGYSMFVVDMVPSFYNKLLDRGAIPCDDGESVQVLEETRLI